MNLALTPETIKVACSNCNLRELCMPAGFTSEDMKKLDEVVATRQMCIRDSSMQARHNQLAPHYASGAIGLTKDGLIAVRDTTAVPLKDRQGINALVAAENADRNALYKEIAAGNGCLLYTSRCV